MKHYYKLIDVSFNPPVTTYFHIETSKATQLLYLRGFVLPLGTRKPKLPTNERIFSF